MKKSSAIEIISTFSKEDLDLFSDFLKSPYFNKIKNAVKLYTEIRRYAPGFDNENIDKEKLWKKIFPGKEYNYGTMKNLIHEFTRLAEKFVTNEIYKKNEIQEFSNLYLGLFQRKLYRILDTKDYYLKNKFSDEALTKYSRDVPEFYYHLTNVYLIKMWRNYFNDMKTDNAQDRISTAESYICSIFMNLVTIYSTIKAYEVNDKAETINLNSIEMILTSISDKTYKEIFAHIRETSEIKYSILNAYFLGFKTMLHKGSVIDYSNFKKYLLNNSRLISATTLRNLTSLLDNALYFVNSSDFDKKKELYEIFSFKLSRNIFLQNNEELAGGIFHYWSKLFFSENKITEFEEFIKKYGDRIAEKDRKDILYLANAQLLFMKCDYDRSLEELSKANFDEFELKIVMKKMQLMINYEQCSYESFLNSFDSYKHFLRNAKFSESILRDTQKKRAKEFFDGINELFRLRTKYDGFNAKKLNKDITEKNIDHKKWFLRKLEELKN
ncbi:MAG: hypothetical protein IPN57_08295 [Ignavibacteria bacterium]|nr:hypothetical protein [Ignavibacteria bacterium]